MDFRCGFAGAYRAAVRVQVGRDPRPHPRRFKLLTPTSVVGFHGLLSFGADYCTTASFSSRLKPWSDRKTRAGTISGNQGALEQQLSKLPQGNCFQLLLPASDPWSRYFRGFQSCSEDRAGRDVPFLAGNLEKFLAAARKRPEIGSISTPSTERAAKVLEVDREKAAEAKVYRSARFHRTIQGLHGRSVRQLLQRFWPYWQCMWRPKRPNVEYGKPRAVLCPQQRGERVPLSALMRFESRDGPEFTMRLQRVPVSADQWQRRARI